MAEKMLRCPKTPSDAELEAERDRKHAEDVQKWLQGHEGDSEDYEW